MHSHFITGPIPKVVPDRLITDLVFSSAIVRDVTAAMQPIQSAPIGGNIPSVPRLIGNQTIRLATAAEAMTSLKWKAFSIVSLALILRVNGANLLNRTNFSNQLSLESMMYE
jgi:hypothetical protein